MSAPSANEVFREAQSLIREGQPVFPVRSAYVDERRKDKAPLTKDGFKGATLDVDRVKAWLKRDRSAALAIPTGVRWDVLDVDVKRDEDGRVHLPLLTRLGLLNGCQRVVRTPSGGWHLYFKAAPGLTNKANATLGMDLRASGGYVLVPPSYIENPEYAGVYQRHDDPVGHDDSPLLWDLIVATITPTNTMSHDPVELLPSERHASIAALREWVSVRKAGERNNALHWAVCRCIDNNIDPRELVEPALLAGLGEDEIMLTINSALKRAGLNADDMDTEMEAMFPNA